MALARDLKLVLHMARGPGREGCQKDRMERLYRGQAADYDAFRDRFLHGRRELYQALAPAPGSRLVELGGGTARNLEFLAGGPAGLGKAWVVDICPSLLAIGRQRRDRLGWTNVELQEGDATSWRPPGGAVDTVVFSYSLTMIPLWFKAVDNALSMLAPGGRLAVVDFFGAPKHPGRDGRRRSALHRAFWRAWFGHDDVFPNPDHPAYLDYRTRRLHFSEHRGRVPYLPLLKAPYYRFIGEKPAS